MDFLANTKEKTGYYLQFSDEFEVPQLDRAKWFPYMLPHWSDLEASAARYTISNGSLQLLIEEDQGPWLPGRDGNNRASNLQTAHFSGPKGSTIGQFRFDPEFVVTADLPIVKSYTPQFGYFETRIKAVPVTGYHIALWLIGCEEEQAGEIRAFEIHGGQIKAEQSRIDYGILRWNDPTLRDECYEDYRPINAAEYHIYAIEWTPTQVDFYIDNIRVRTSNQSPQYPMQFMFGVYERPHERLKNSHTEEWPKVCEVDYFRAYQPVGEYALP